MCPKLCQWQNPSKVSKVSKISQSCPKSLVKKVTICHNIPKIPQSSYQQWIVSTGRPASCNPKGSSALVEDLRTFRSIWSSHCLHQLLTRMVFQYFFTLLWLQLCCLIHHLNHLFDNIVVFVCDRNICCLNHLFGFPLGSARTAAAENIEDGN